MRTDKTASTDQTKHVQGEHGTTQPIKRRPKIEVAYPSLEADKTVPKYLISTFGGSRREPEGVERVRRVSKTGRMEGAGHGKLRTQI